MTDISTILLITADDSAGHLTALAAEVNHIQHTLNSVQRREYEIVVLQQATAEELIKEFNVPGRSIELIHYAGHADSRQLALTDGPATAAALAEKIRLAGTVKLLFLNGCSTREQVDFFHEAGVSFVIGTVRPVDDQQAAWMSRQLYAYLANGRALRSAMQSTVADAHLTRRPLFATTDGIVRTPVAVDALAEAETEETDWGLWIKPSLDNTADYALTIRPLDRTTSAIPTRSFLEGLVFALAGSDHDRMATVRELEVLIDRGSDVSEEALKHGLSDILPLTLAVRLQRLLAKPERPDYPELAYNYTILYETLLQHAVAILLARAWNERLVTDETGRSVIRNYIRQNHLSTAAESCRPVLSFLVDWLETALGPESIAYLKPLLAYLASTPFQEASDFFFLQKQSHHQRLRLDEEEVIHHCVQAQQFILQAMPCFLFLVENLMVSIRDIDVRNQRYLAATEFDNIFYRLEGNKANRLTKSDAAMSENKSILFFQGGGFQVGLDSLNLFPFIFDRNVFADKTNEKVDLYVFCGYFPPPDKDHDCYHFFSVQSPSLVWCFDEQEREASLLHLGEKATLVHLANNLMVKTGELRQYLRIFKAYFIDE